MSKRQRPRSKKINVTPSALYSTWSAIVNSVHCEEVPIPMMDNMTIILMDGTSINIRVQQIISEGNDPAEVESYISEKLVKLGDLVDEVNYFICVDAVAKAIQPETDKYLKDLQKK